jgi:hypothetical protein
MVSLIQALTVATSDQDCLLAFTDVPIQEGAVSHEIEDDSPAGDFRVMIAARVVLSVIAVSVDAGWLCQRSHQNVGTVHPTTFSLDRDRPQYTSGR